MPSQFSIPLSLLFSISQFKPHYDACPRWSCWDFFEDGRLQSPLHKDLRHTEQPPTHTTLLGSSEHSFAPEDNIQGPQ